MRPSAKTCRELDRPGLLVGAVQLGKGGREPDQPGVVAGRDGGGPFDDGTPPREWAERLYNIRRWTPMPSGGHFPSAEQPDLLGRDIAAFFNDLRQVG